jgi:hypothetical protein
LFDNNAATTAIAAGGNQLGDDAASPQFTGNLCPPCVVPPSRDPCQGYQASE